MNEREMRRRVSEAYRGDWPKQVAQMSREQVYAIWMRMVESGEDQQEHPEIHEPEHEQFRLF